jgi:hypothetical protein
MFDVSALIQMLLALYLVSGRLILATDFGILETDSLSFSSSPKFNPTQL